MIRDQQSPSLDLGISPFKLGLRAGLLALGCSACANSPTSFDATTHAASSTAADEEDGGDGAGSQSETTGDVSEEETPKGEYKLVWSDEFDKDGPPDETRWSFDVDGNAWDWGNNEEQNYTPEDHGNAWVEDGQLVIEARRERWTSPVDDESKEYTSARLRTLDKGDWKYGRFEMRAILPSGLGTWPAFWMLPSENVHGNWPKSGEIDIMEHIGSEPDRVYATAWAEALVDTHGDGNHIEVEDCETEFHVYRVDWTAKSLEFFVDDRRVHRYVKSTDDPKRWPFNEKFHLLLNLAVGGDWEKKVDPEVFPARFIIDYVRVYQRE